MKNSMSLNFFEVIHAAAMGANLAKLNRGISNATENQPLSPALGGFVIEGVKLDNWAKPLF